MADPTADVRLTSAALSKAVFLSQNLAVNENRMRWNVAASNGLMLAEAINFALAEHMDRTEAKQLIKASVQVTLAANRHLVDVVREQAASLLDVDAIDWAALKDESAYFGSADTFIDRVLQAADREILAN